MAAVIAESRPTALQGLSRLPILRQGVLLIAIAASVALGVAVALWSQQPTYALLYASLAGNDADAVMGALQEAKIEFRIQHDSGALLVPAKQVHEARLKLAALGLPKGTALGFELLGQQRSFGTSQFIERARYQHALEVELARTISSVNNVISARVHLALPRQSAFLRKGRQPSASVFVRLAPGRQLDRGQPGAVAHMVAAAVPNLEPGRVRVIDDKGRLLTRDEGDDGLGLSAHQIDYLQAIEGRYIERIENLLGAVVGPSAINAQVVAELDFSRTEQSTEQFLPQSAVVRSEQVLEERSRGALFGGVPGALSNQPPLEASAPETLAAGETSELAAVDGSDDGVGNQEKTGNSRRESTRNFELDRILSHTSSAAGAVQRLSAAVVIDDRLVHGQDGAVTWVSRTPEEVANLTALVKDAIGFDAERGDNVSVINASFVRPEPVEALPELALWKQPWVWDVARQVGGGLLVLIVAFGVLRPMMRNLVGREVTERELEQRNAAAALPAPVSALTPGQEAGAALAPPDGGATLPDLSTQEHDLEAVRELVHQDPRRVANVMKNWVSENG